MNTQRKPINKTGLKITLLIISLSQLGSMAISSVISEILEAFPDVPDQTVQFLMTFPGLFILITSLLSAFLARYISQKKLAVTGLILNTATAVGGLLFHGNIFILFCWAATLGLGIGMWMPLVNAIASAHFEGNERASLLGRVSSAQNIGAVFMTVAGGALAVMAWHFVYLVYFIAVPGLICAVIYLPDEKAHSESRRSGGLGIDGAVILFSVIQFFFSLPYNAAPANFSLLLAENRIGSTQAAGILSGLFLFGGIISGWIFGALDKRIHKFTIPLGFLFLAAGFTGLGCTHSFAAYALFSVVGGMSIPLVLPQSSLGVVENKRPGQFAMASAVLLAFGNLGAFFSPVTTSFSSVIMGSDSIASRMIFCAALSVIGAAVTAVILKIRKENEDHV